MKEALANVAREIAAEARKEQAKLKPALAFILFGIAMAVACCEHDSVGGYCR